MADKQKPRAFLDEDQPFCPPLTVYESADGPIDTGLFNGDGTKIFRHQQIGPIGFDLTKNGAR